MVRSALVLGNLCVKEDKLPLEGERVTARDAVTASCCRAVVLRNGGVLKQNASVAGALLRLSEAPSWESCCSGGAFRANAILRISAFPRQDA